MPKLILVNPMYPNELRLEYEGSAVVIIVHPATNKVERVSFMSRDRANKWLDDNAGKHGNRILLLGLVSIVGEVFSVPEPEREIGTTTTPTRLPN